ncbi:MAG: response regulator [Lachnospiraceae bacterium]|nr:response regulator [Lachnospiraceae bacterium]
MEVFRYVNTATESLCFIISFILFIYQAFKEKKKDSSNRWFGGMLFFNMLMILGDLADWIFSGRPGEFIHIFQVLFITIMYFAATGLLVYSVHRWVISVAEQKQEVSSVYKILSMIFCIIQLVIAVTNPLMGRCYVDENNVYQRGDGYLFTVLLPYVVFALTLVFIIIHRKAFTIREMIYMTMFVVVPIASGIFQLMTYIYSTLNVAITIALVIGLNFIQSQREIVNEESEKRFAEARNRQLGEMHDYQMNLSEQLIEVLCEAVEAKDRYTRGHSLRVARYTKEIMYRLGGSEEEQEKAYFIGILHDIGKIAVKDEIINNSGRLSEDQYEQIKLHTIAGYQILRTIDIIPEIAVGARWHHERYDGKGYPNGLSGENIPLIARIISVADAYDAMTSNRSYQKTLPQDLVREEILKGMGTQFDPKIAKIMVDMIDEDISYDMKQVNENTIESILMIDDDAVQHNIVRQVLIDEDYNLDSAFGGEEGISLLKQNPYDLCLLDMEMPGMNGFEVLEWIHNNMGKMKVIFLTGDKDIETINTAERLGARDYITKPINAFILKESINSVLRH